MSRYWNPEKDDIRTFPILRDLIGAILLVTVAVMWGCPVYSVWEQGLVGQAELARAEQNRQIAIKEAQAKRDSAKLLADAEVERARGVAAANTIIGEGLEGHDEYLKYLWIMGMEHVAASPNGSTVVYVPTEANIPIMEAPRLTIPKPAP